MSLRAAFLALVLGWDTPEPRFDPVARYDALAARVAAVEQFEREHGRLWLDEGLLLARMRSRRLQLGMQPWGVNEGMGQGGGPGPGDVNSEAY